MKSTIATILGTAALGLIKSKMGSGIRIRMKNVTKVAFQVWIGFKTNIKSDDKQSFIKIWRILRNLPPQLLLDAIEGNEIGKVRISFDSIAFFEKEDDIFLSLKDGYYYIPFVIKCETEEDIDLVKEEIEIGIFGDNSPLIKGLIELTDGHLIDVYTIDFNDGFQSIISKSSIIVNADTGEEYKPEMEVSKLRKR